MDEDDQQADQVEEEDAADVVDGRGVGIPKKKESK